MSEKIITINQGTLPTAREAEEIRQSLVKGDWTVEPPLVQVETEGATHLSWQHPQAIWAKVTGSSSPYSFKEGRRKEGGEWVECCVEGESNAYEVNHVTGLNGTYQLLYPGSKGDWRFMSIRDGLRIDDFHLFAPSWCREVTAPFHNGDCFVHLYPPAEPGGVGEEDGNALYYIKSVTVTNDEHPGGLNLYTAPANPGFWSSRYDTNDPPLGRYKVVVGTVERVTSYYVGDYRPENKRTEPVCTYATDEIVSEFEVGGDGYVPSFVAADGGRVCDVWWVPGPHVTSSVKTMKGASQNNSYAGRLVGYGPYSNSLKIGTVYVGPFNPFSAQGWADIRDAIRVPNPADTKVKGTLTFWRGYFVGGIGGEYRREYCPTDYYASMCGIYKKDRTPAYLEVIPFDPSTCVPEGYGSELPSQGTQAKFAMMSASTPAMTPQSQPILAASDGRIRVGLVTPHLNYGGGEVWNDMLMRSTALAVNWVGVVCTDPVEKTNPDMVAATAKLAPIEYGMDKIPGLASRCDVIVTWLVEDWDRYAGDSAAKVIYVMHFAQEKEYSDLVKWCLNRTTALVGVSELCNPGVPASWTSRYKVIYNAVDTEKMIVRRSKAVMRSLWGVPLSAKVALFYARIHLTRRPDAMVRLVSSLPSDWHCVVMGDAQQSRDEYQSIVSMLTALPASDRVRIHLLPADPATGDVMNASDVLVNPTFADSFGLAMVEAMAVRLPVVSTSCGVAKLHPELVYSIAVDDSGANLAKAVQTAKLGGPKLGAQTFATVTCSPSIFGLAWITLITATASRPIVPGVFSMAMPADTNLSRAVSPQPTSQPSGGCNCGGKVAAALNDPERQARREEFERKKNRRRNDET